MNSISISGNAVLARLPNSRDARLQGGALLQAVQRAAEQSEPLRLWPALAQVSAHHGGQCEARANPERSQKVKSKVL
jgi:hypothetical protein